jgi:GrpB-like predicted nucleotidyltransferase (UPF0157 family)
MEKVRFVNEVELRRATVEAFKFRETQLSRCLPFAEIEHIGSTAIPGALTKGDLDVLVRTAAREFRLAVSVLAGLFAKNEGTPWTETFASFKDDAANPLLGVQLVVRGTEWDVFSHFRDTLKRDPQLVAEYNRLKERFHDQSMNEYRSSKDEFIQQVLLRHPIAHVGD